MGKKVGAEARWGAQGTPRGLPQSVHAVQSSPRDGAELGGRARMAGSATDIPLELNPLFHTFLDVDLEQDFRQSTEAGYVRKVVGLFSLWAILTAAVVARNHIMGLMGDEGWLEVVALYTNLVVTSAVVLALCGRARLPGWASVDVLVCVASLVCVTLSFMGLAFARRRDERNCGDQVDCNTDSSFTFGFRAGLVYVGIGLSFLGTMRQFVLFALAGASLPISFLVVFGAFRLRAAQPPDIVLMLVVYLALLWVHRSNALFERRQYMWYMDTVRLTQVHLNKMEKAREQKQRVVGYLFHEVRNPINDIVLATSLALDCMGRLNNPSNSNNPQEANHDGQPSGQDDDGTPEPVQELHGLLQVVSNSATAASRVLDDALDLQKLEAGRFAFVQHPFVLSEMYEPVVCALNPRYAAKQVKLEVEQNSEVAGVVVEGDLKRLRQVVHNFLSNALKFTPAEGRVVVSAQVLSRNSQRDGTVQVRLGVSDTGIGLSAEDQAKMFTAWSQVRAAETQAGGGTGLGLALSKDFIEKGHHGRIGCASPGELGQGTTFYFEIHMPLGVLARPPSSSHLPPQQHAAHEEIGRGMTGAENEEPMVLDVLLVDDSVVTRRLLGRMLRDLGVTFHCAENGKEAVEKVKDHAYRLVFMDKEMPVMNGHDAVMAIRVLDNAVPIVGVTGNALDEQRREFLACGVNKVVTKPLGKDQLVALLQSFGVLPVH